MVVESRNHRFLPPLLGKAGNITPPPSWLFLRVLRSGAVLYSFLPPQLKRASSPYLNNSKYLPIRKENLVISFTSTLCCAFFLAACTAYLEGVSTALAELLRNYSYSKNFSERFCLAPTARSRASPVEIKTRCLYERWFRARERTSIMSGRLLGKPGSDLFARVERELLEYVGYMVVHRALGDHEH
jgi:hypothetical protein